MFLLPRSRTARALLAIAAVASALVFAWPLTPALSTAESFRIRLVSCLATILACVAVGFSPPLKRRWILDVLAGAGALAGAAMIWPHLQAQTTCVGDYAGQPIVIGHEYSAAGFEYLRHNPGQSVADMLLDVRGTPDLLWTAASIARCRFLVGWSGPLAIALFAAAVALIAVRSRGSYARVAPAPHPPPSAAPGPDAQRRYDAFISYRRLDRERAEWLAEEIEARGYRVAIDFRDFRPNEPVLVEMERCVLESRFVLCVITAQYASSGFTSEEALMARLLDLTERRNRIVPLIFERVTMPVWLQGLVGITFMPDAQIDPIDKLVTLLATPE